MDDGWSGASTRREPPGGYDIGPEIRVNTSQTMPVTVVSLNENLETIFHQEYIAAPPNGVFEEVLDESEYTPPFRVPPRNVTNATDKAYYSEAARLKTFEEMWLDDYYVKPKDLAREGFIHVGPRDKVKCVFGLHSLKNWEPDDTVEGEHKKHYRDCPFINGKCDHLNIPINPTESMKRSLGLKVKTSEQFASKSSELMRDFTDRLTSYRMWPKSAPIRPDALAEAGLYYIGQEDMVRCFECAQIITEWRLGDDPWIEHAKLSPRCPFVHSVKGSGFIQQILHANKDKDVPVAMEISNESVNYKQSNGSSREQTAINRLPEKMQPLPQPVKVERQRLYNSAHGQTQQLHHSVQVSTAQIEEDLKSAPVQAVCQIYDVPIEQMRQMIENIRISKGTSHIITRKDFEGMTGLQ